MKKYILLSILTIVVVLPSCNDFLEEKVFTEYDATEFLATKEGVNSVLAATYRASTPVIRERWHLFAGFTTDTELETGGGFASTARAYADFNAGNTENNLRVTWEQIYQGVRNANSFIDNIDAVTSLTLEERASLKGEARFLRAFNYMELYDLWGPVPLVISSLQTDFQVPKATDARMREFIETELTEAAAALPITQSISGKATRGAALSFLGRFLLNTKQWQKSADILQQVMALNEYDLLSNEDLPTLFAVDNEHNEEIIFAFEAITSLTNNKIMAHNYPTGYPTELQNWGANLMLNNDFVNTYLPGDRRALAWDPTGAYGPASKGWILYRYEDKSGRDIDLLNGTIDGIPSADAFLQTRSFKYTPDEAFADFENYANDLVFMRYADVLLMRAEALNEVTALAPEAITLVNEIRTRAGIPDLAAEDIASRESLRSAILRERGWEFITEGLRRRDMIRQGVFISNARARGKTVEDHQVLFPIPQADIDANPKLKQNDGYPEE